MGIAGCMLTVEAYISHKLQNSLLSLFLAGIELMDIQRLSDDISNCHSWVKGGIWILEHHGSLGPVFLHGRLVYLLSIVDDLTGSRLVEMEDGAPRSGLSTARLTHKAQGLTLLDGEGNVVYSLKGFGLEKTHIDIEILLEVIYFYKNLIFLHALASFSRVQIPSSMASFTFIQHPEMWSSLILILSGRFSRQTFIALSQRGAKGQPLGIFNRSIGVPVIGCSLFPAVSAVGMDLRSPLVYS